MDVNAGMFVTRAWLCDQHLHHLYPVGACVKIFPHKHALVPFHFCGFFLVKGHPKRGHVAAGVIEGPDPILCA